MATISSREKCITAFTKGKFYRDSSAMWTDGCSIYSYAMRLATRNAKTGEITYAYEPGTRISATTSYHMRALEFYVPRNTDPRTDPRA